MKTPEEILELNFYKPKETLQHYDNIITCMEDYASQLKQSKYEENKPQKDEGLYFVWDGINGDLEQFYTLKQAQDYIKEEFDDEAEGIHPDVESVFIVKKILNTEVEVIKELNSGLGEKEYCRIIFEEPT